MKKGLEKKIDVVAGVFDNTMLNVRQCNGLEISREPFYAAVSIYHRLAEVFNQCENSNQVLLAFKHWESVHPLMKVIPVAWNYGMPFGLLYSKNPDKKCRKCAKTSQITGDVVVRHTPRGRLIGAAKRTDTSIEG